MWAQVGENNGSIFAAKIKMLRDMIQEGISLDKVVQVFSLFSYKI
jgi:hypothetical protein